MNIPFSFQSFAATLLTLHFRLELTVVMMNEDLFYSEADFDENEASMNKNDVSWIEFDQVTKRPLNIHVTFSSLYIPHTDI